MATRDSIVIPCPVKECANEQSDLTLYNLNDALYYNGTALSVIAYCPDGYACAPGTFPQVFTYPPGTFGVVVPPSVGFPVVLSINGCEENLRTVLPAGSNQAAIQAAAAVLQQQAAEQQARCDAINLAGPRLPTSISLSDIDSASVCANTPFTATVYATASPFGAPYTMFTVFPPAWMTDAQSGSSLVLSGTPTTIGAVTFNVDASGTDSYGSKSYTLNIVGIANASPLPDAPINGAYSETLDGSSIPGILTWSIIAGALPSWATLNSATGVIFGTPTLADIGLSTFTVQASNGTLSCSKEFDLLAICCFSNGNPPDADTTPVAYNFQLVPCQAADPAFAYSITAGSLPPGLTLGAATGLISGNPTTPGTYPFTVSVTGVAFPCSEDYTIEAACQPTVSDVAPGHMGNLALGAAGSIELGPFYVIQRTGLNRTMNFRGVGTWYSRAGLGVTWGTQIFNDETGVYIGFYGGNSVSGGGGGNCASGATDLTQGYSMLPCTRYRLEPFITITGAPLGFCTSSFDFYATWV